MILAAQRLTHIPLAVGAPLGTPLGLSPCNRWITIPLFPDWAIDVSPELHQRITERRVG